MDHLALGLQKWVGWEEGDQDICCLKGDGSTKQSTGIGKACTCSSTGGGATCCTGGTGGSATTCHECKSCGTGPSASDPNNKCYLSAYNKTDAQWTNIVNGTPGSAGSADLVKAAQDVHLLARIFLGSVCLIWSGLSQLGFLTGGGNNKRWKDSKLHEIEIDANKGLGSFMAAMGYDLERLNQGADEKQCVSGALYSNLSDDDHVILLNIMERYDSTTSVPTSTAEKYYDSTDETIQSPTPRSYYLLIMSLHRSFYNTLHLDIPMPL
ncbi:variant erythrocyte surface antigen-1 beta subunit [Babesia bovis T2Bo]|uniref:variant erythrocyte surface antigen-1 beta subunit n=1 Tax=Babesia bovis T2Bo TaxID=484906 RepID=UPI001C343B17|nr:variant erythrocyte surface antigen-1 beta subunit [Babesia bovis T2Bo]KAG6440095.1 variant erythrocyte surface antigen-1 beta subunit [Babesia bovis T2Bo]